MMSIRRSVMVLSASATATAIYLSVLAGWQRGGALPERLVWVAIGAVLVACAHLLPALARESPPAVRIAAAVLWAASLFATSYGHLTFFLLAQQHAGELRGATRPVIESQPGRSLTVVMAQRANVTAGLAAANAQRCSANCPMLERRRVTLAAELDALDAEADDVRRGQVAQDRALARHEALVADPVTVRLAELLGSTFTQVELLSGLMFAAVLEGVACLLWTIALRRPAQALNSSPAVSSGASAKSNLAALSHKPKRGSRASVTKAVTPRTFSTPVSHVGSEDDLTRLRQAIAVGELRLTVTNIRKHLRCSQARASALRRQLERAPGIS